MSICPHTGQNIRGQERVIVRGENVEERNVHQNCSTLNEPTVSKSRPEFEGDVIEQPVWSSLCYGDRCNLE